MEETLQVPHSSGVIARNVNPQLIVTASALLTLALSWHSITPYMRVASGNFFILLLGLTLRKSRPIAHARLMTAAITSDLLLVLTLQYQRSAIQTALAFKLSALNQAHIFCSSAATLLYIPMLIMGYRLYSARKERRTGSAPDHTWHRSLGFLTLAFRTLGFFLMFSMLNK